MKIKLLILCLSFISLSAASKEQHDIAHDFSFNLCLNKVGRYAAQKIEVLQSVFDAGLDVNYIYPNNGDSFLHRVARFGTAAFLPYLIDEKKIKINTQNKDGETALHQPMLHYSNIPEETRIVELLVLRKADIYIKDNKQQSPYDLTKKLAEKNSEFKPMFAILQKRADEIDQSKHEADKAEMELLEYLPKEVAAVVGDYVRE